MSLTDLGTTLLYELAPQIRQNTDDFFKRTFSKNEKAMLAQLLGQLLRGEEDSTP